MIKLLIFGIVGLVVIVSSLIIVRNKPELWFWAFLNLYFDPGGFVYGFLGGLLFGPLNYWDVFITAMVFCMLTANINWKVILLDKFLLRFLIFLSVFAAYYYIVYGAVAPIIHNDFDYTTFLIKNRAFAYGFIILIGVYVFSLRSLNYFYTITLSFGVVSLTLFAITLLTGVELVPVEESARYSGDEMTRISLLGYGMFYLIFPLAMINYFLSNKISMNLQYRKWLYYGGIMLVITMLITLSRRIHIEIIGTILIITMIISYLFGTIKLSAIFKVIFATIIVVIVLYFTLPRYVGYIAEIGKDTFLLMTTGKDSRGVGDQRVSGSDEYEIVKEYITDNLLIGTGYTYLHWGRGYATSIRGDRFAIAADAAGEVPIYYLLFGYGLAGVILMLPLYFIMLKLSFKLIIVLKQTMINYVNQPLIIILSIYISLYVLSKFSYKIYTLSMDFTGENFSYTAVIMGIGLAIHRKLHLNTLSEIY